MKKLLLLAFILSLAVMGFASPEARGVWIQLVGTPLDINTYVNTPIFVHDTDFSLSVVCSAYPTVTVTSENVAMPEFCSVWATPIADILCSVAAICLFTAFLRKQTIRTERTAHLNII